MIEAKLRRLNTLAGSDPGFYVLAVHSFVEHYIRDIASVSVAEQFRDVIWEFRLHLLAQAPTVGPSTEERLGCLSRLSAQHRFTNKVRHGFYELAPEEALAATHLVVAFCTLIGCSGVSEVRALERSLTVWDTRDPRTGRSSVLDTMQAELIRLQSRNRELLDQLDSYADTERRVWELENQIQRFTLELDEARGRAKAKDRKADELRAERAELREERKRLLQEMRGYEELERYLQSLGRLGLYTRTRMDYERTLLRLTPEQEDAVADIDGSADHLIRGPAGTGKSLVLIEALRRRLGEPELDLQTEEPRGVVLLTFTRTLARFEHYVTLLLGFEDVGELVQTVDKFMLDRLQRINSKYAFDFEAVSRSVAELNDTDFFTNDELSAEIEAYLYGNLITREEYLNEIVPRVGMRRRLARSQREKVWAIRETIDSRMRERGEFSRNFARLVILEALEGPEAAKLRDVRTVFVDETQDLTAGDLRTLRGLVAGHLVMASDLQQSIYGVSSPYARAGINIKGRTKLLRTNFRNTRQIYEAALRFLPGGDTETFAFRDGPVPELYTAEKQPELWKLLLRKLKLYLERLEYEPDNVCILVPHKEVLERVLTDLEGEGIAASQVTAPDFEFSASGTVRVSTLHSSKGLDFPVVLLYLPYLNRRRQFDPTATERLLRNLVFVGLTRAMEHLNVFMIPGEDPILADLEAALSVDAASGGSAPE
jgi:hypothetical protein